MIFHFVILSAEAEDFTREILIDASNTFETFHESIQQSVNYDKSQLASFFLSDNDWQKGQEITLLPMDFSGTGNQLLMKDVVLKDLIENKKDKLIYVFDYFGNRGFFIELLNVGENRNLAESICITSKGEAPEQIKLEDIGMDVDELTDLMDEQDEKDALDFSDDIDSLGYDDLSEEDYSELF